MLNTLQQFAAPYAEWLMGNRNAAILVLSGILFVETCALLIHRWRLEKLSADLEQALKRAAAQTVRPTYVSPHTPGELPPVKGGITYARNLGPALERVYGGPPASSPAPLPGPAGYREPGLPPAWPGAAPPRYPTPPYAPPTTLYPPLGPPPAPPTYQSGPVAPPPPPPASYYPPPPAPQAAPAYPESVVAQPPAPAPLVEPVPAPPPEVRASQPAPAEAPALDAATPADRLRRWLPRMRSRMARPAAPAEVGPPPPAPEEPGAAAPQPEAEADGAPAPHAQALPGSLAAAMPQAPALAEVTAVPEELTETHPLTAQVEVPAPPHTATATSPPVASPEGEPAIAVPPVPAEATPRGDAGDSLLLIEDDEKVAKYYAMIFESRGYRVSVANDGVAGVDMATRLHPGLILLDVMMPRQNGMMVLQTLRATPATEDTPIVILSNFTEPTLIQRALQLGAVEYVVKTQVQAEALANAVPKWLHHERAFA